MRKTPGKRQQVHRNRRLWDLGQPHWVRNRRIGRFKRIRKFLFKFVVSLLCLLFFYQFFTLPISSILSLDTENPKKTALMQQRIEEARNQKKKFVIDHRWISITKIPKHVRRAVLIAEDSRFYTHTGIDWYEVGESFEKNWEEGRIVRGGSTITQQLAKNLYLSTSRDPIRKFTELIIAWILEATLNKKRILELYLNSIEWGRGIFGIEAAAQYYFHKSAGQLTRGEAARLAAVIPGPLRYKPTQLTPFLEKKKEVILRRMSTR